MAKPSIIGTPACAAASSITLPTHAVGDTILIFAYRDGSNTPATVPTAGGTVPAWVLIEGGSQANTNAQLTYYFIATATNHTSGTWTNATGMAAIVFRAHASAPIGLHAQGGSAANGASITVTDFAATPTLDGNSQFVTFGGYRTVTAWGTPPSGYTNQANVSTECFINTQDTTTSQGGYNQPTTQTGNGGYRTVVVEVLPAAAGNVSITVPAAVGTASGPTPGVAVSPTPSAAVATATGNVPGVAVSIPPAAAVGTATGNVPGVSLRLAPSAAVATASAATPNVALRISPAAAVATASAATPGLSLRLAVPAAVGTASAPTPGVTIVTPSTGGTPMRSLMGVGT